MFFTLTKRRVLGEGLMQVFRYLNKLNNVGQSVFFIYVFSKRLKTIKKSQQFQKESVKAPLCTILFTLLISFELSLFFFYLEQRLAGFVFPVFFL